jgi:diguanylate cyclase (GGDEF)-like protein/PAS domain S-box-containing protein
MRYRSSKTGAALVLIIAAVAAAGAILALRGHADRARLAQLVTVELSADANRLNGLEWEAKANGHFTAEASAAVDAVQADMEANLRELVDLRASGVIELNVRAAVTRYRRALALERKLFEAGEIRAAEEVDEQRVDPAFSSLARLLRQAGAEEARATRRAATRADLGTVGVIAAATLLLLVVLALRRRDAVRAAERVERARTDAILEDSSDLITLVGNDGRIASVSHSVEAILGFLPHEITGRPLHELIHPDDWAIADAVLARLPSGAVRTQERAEWRVKHRNGYWLHVETVVNNRLHDPRVGAVVLTTRDVSERKAFEEQLRHRAFHDPLTQLANRALFHDRTQHALAREERYEQHVAVLFMDLDDFKLVNDRLGHAAGDQLLAGVAKRLRASVRSADTAARLGGDEFGVLLEGVVGPDEALCAAQRILAAFEEPFELEGTPVLVRPSIGVALAGREDTGADELHRNADLAMYAAKTAGKGRVELFRPEMHADFHRRFPSDTQEPDRITWFVRSEEERTEITRLLAEPDSITAVFQPILDLSRGVIAGYEALARFPTAPEQRPPNAWFAQAHRFDLGFDLEAKALHAALAASGRPGDTYLAINLSPSALRADHFAELYARELTDIVIEITEHEMVLESDWLGAGLARLRERGARIAVDDAGAGYAGLRQLMTLRPEIIKLDRKLVDSVADDDAKRALTEAFVHFADRIGAATCAEGIERLDDLHVLADLGVTYGQGYAIARPAAPWATVAPEALTACIESPPSVA